MRRRTPTVWIVEEGEKNYGGAVLGVRKSLAGATKLAKSRMSAKTGMGGIWHVKIDVTESKDQGEWMRGLDYISITRMRVFK